MTPAVASAPGKLILVGEHAAVFGHRALVAAVDLRLDTRLEPRTDERVVLRLDALDRVIDTRWPAILELTRARRSAWRRSPVPPPDAPPENLALLALGEAATELGLDRAGVDVTIRSRLPVGCGLGSSAALAAGIAAALELSTSGAFSPGRVERIAGEVERRQHGTPSGIDAATVIDGGLLWARRAAGGSLERRSLPSDGSLASRLRVYHSGAPAETTGVVVGAVRERVASRPDCAAAIERLGELADDPQPWTGDAPGTEAGLVESIREAERLLERLGVVPSEVQEVVRAIEARGGAAKISGAGSLTGPAAGCVLVYEPGACRHVARAVPGAWRPIEGRLGAPGLTGGVDP